MRSKKTHIVGTLRITPETAALLWKALEFQGFEQKSEFFREGDYRPHPRLPKQPTYTQSG
jgi:hypothetical protein